MGARLIRLDARVEVIPAQLELAEPVPALRRGSVPPHPESVAVLDPPAALPPWRAGHGLADAGALLAEADETLNDARRLNARNRRSTPR